jgi:2-keto-3-deoxy-6-phosphogluconate aldolase
LNVAQVDASVEAGARYIISPNINDAVVLRTKEKGLISIPGAMTPSEILRADELGADFVKIFPYIDLGSQYIKNIRGPINHVKFLATAGVTENNFAEVLSAGFCGAGISGRLTDKSAIASGDYAELTHRAEAFVRIAKGE